MILKPRQFLAGLFVFLILAHYYRFFTRNNAEAINLRRIYRQMRIGQNIIFFILLLFHGNFNEHNIIVNDTASDNDVISTYIGIATNDADTENVEDFDFKLTNTISDKRQIFEYNIIISNNFSENHSSNYLRFYFSDISPPLLS